MSKINSQKQLEELLGTIIDVERDFYELQKEKMLSESGLNLEILCGKLNLKSQPEIKVLNLLKPFVSLLHVSKNHAEAKYKKRTVAQSMRNNLDLLPLFLDDLIKVSFTCNNVTLFELTNEVANLIDPIIIKDNKQFFLNVLDNHPILCNLKLIKEGQSRKIIEEEIIKTDKYLEALFRRFQNRLMVHKGYPPSQNTSLLRLKLLNISVEADNARIYFKESLCDNIKLHQLKFLSKDLMILTKIMEDFLSAISNEKLLKLNAEQSSYVTKLQLYIKNIEDNKPLLTNSNGEIEIPVGNVRN